MIGSGQEKAADQDADDQGGRNRGGEQEPLAVRLRPLLLGQGSVRGAGPGDN